MISYDYLLLKNGWIEEHRLRDGGVWFSHPTKGDLTIEPEGQWEWTHSNGSVSKGYNPRDLEKALSKGESMTLSKAGRIINMLAEEFEVGGSVQDISSGKSGKIKSVQSRDKDKNPLTFWIEWEDGEVQFKKVVDLKPFGKDAE